MPRSALTLLIAAAALSLSNAPLPQGPPSVDAGPPPAPAPSSAAAAVTPAPSSVAKAVRAGLSNRCNALAHDELSRLTTVLLRESRSHSLPPRLVVAVIDVESRCDPFAVSQAGAVGLMQLLPSTAAELARQLDIPWRGPQTLFDPVSNVRLGVAYLRELVDRYGRMATALAAYNWGPGRIDAWLRRGRPLPSRYAQRVLDVYSRRRAAAGPGDS